MGIWLNYSLPGCGIRTENAPTGHDLPNVVEPLSRRWADKISFRFLTMPNKEPSNTNVIAGPGIGRSRCNLGRNSQRRTGLLLKSLTKAPRREWKTRSNPEPCGVHGVSASAVAGFRRAAIQ
jgi:hypothetical protein